MTPHWQLLKFPSLDDIALAREQCHQAIQNVAAVGRSFLPESKLDENANLTWDSKLQRLVGRWVETDKITFRSSISITEFTVYLVNREFETISSIALQDNKQTDVMIWLERQLGELGFEFSKINLAYPYKIPEYPTAKGQPFHIDNWLACQELCRLYHNTSHLLINKFRKEENVSGIRCWPHHFDMALTITLLDTGDHQTSKRINVGMSPGDEYYNEPYFYVSPWPYPVKNLPDISDCFAHWHQENWVGAVLPLSQINHLKTAVDQKHVVNYFYDRGIKALKELI